MSRPPIRTIYLLRHAHTDIGYSHDPFVACEVSGYLKFILNSLGAGEYMKLYPTIGQNMYTWAPDPKIANRVYEADGRRWWEMEISMDIKDLQLPGEIKAGDKMDILLAADLKFAKE